MPHLEPDKTSGQNKLDHSHRLSLSAQEYSHHQKNEENCTQSNKAFIGITKIYALREMGLLCSNIFQMFDTKH